MATTAEMKKSLLPDLEAKYNALEKIAFEFHQMEEDELESLVIKRMSGLKLMIDHCKNA